MAAPRISTPQLERQAERTAEALGYPKTALWCSHTPNGWRVLRTFGNGWRALGEGLTAREALQLLRGLEIGADLASRALVPSLL